MSRPSGMTTLGRLVCERPWLYWPVMIAVFPVYLVVGLVVGLASATLRAIEDWRDDLSELTEYTDE